MNLYKGNLPHDEISPLKSIFIAKALWLLDSSNRGQRGIDRLILIICLSE